MSETTSVGLLGTLIERWRKTADTMEELSSSAARSDAPYMIRKLLAELEAALATLPRWEDKHFVVSHHELNRATNGDFLWHCYGQAIANGVLSRVDDVALVNTSELAALPPAPPQTQEPQGLSITVEDINAINALLEVSADGQLWAQRKRIADLMWKLTFLGQRIENQSKLAASPPAQEQDANFQKLLNAITDAELPVCATHVDAEFVCPECFKAELAAAPPAQGCHPIETDQEVYTCNVCGGDAYRGDHSLCASANSAPFFQTALNLLRDRIQQGQAKLQEFDEGLKAWEISAGQYSLEARTIERRELAAQEAVILAKVRRRFAALLPAPPVATASND